MGFWEKFKFLSSKCWEEMKEKPKYFFCFICLFVTRLITVLFSVYLQLWVISFQKSGVLSSTEESDKIYMQVIAGALFSILLVAPVFGFVSDKADPRVIMPSTFFVRGVITFLFSYIDNPNNWHAYFICVTMIVLSVIQFICVEVVFMRNMKKEIRGTLSGIAVFFGSIGTTTFALVGGIIFDKIGPWAPFVVVAIADLIVVFISFIFIITGKINRSD